MTTIDITSCGAVAGQVCTAAIQQAIDTLHDQGGGTVLIPAGTYLSGTIILKSGITLHVSPNAVLKSTGRLEDHPEIESTLNKGHTGPGGKGGPGDIEKHHFIHAAEACNITITGGGVIDGSGPDFWDLANTAPSGWIPARRPRVSPMLDFTCCRRLVLRDIRIKDSPGWTIHPFCCDDVVIDNVRVENNLFGPNTDGIDINGCRDVFITNCHLTCGDDCIIIKATRSARSTERVLISNCVVTTNCIGIGIGQETESDVRQVTVSNCVMYNCHRMFAIGLWNGGTVEDVTVTGCVGDTLGNFPLARPIHLDVKRHGAHDDAALGVLRNVSISNFVCRTDGRIMITGERPGTIDNLTLRDITLDCTILEDAATLSPPDGAKGSSQYSNRNLEARRQHAAVIIENVDHLQLDGLTCRWPDPAPLPYHALWARGIAAGHINVPTLTPAGGALQALVLDRVNARVTD